MKPERAVDDRLLDSCVPEPNTGCWLWMGAVNSRGYGYIRIATKTKKAHRVSYEQFVGEIPDGLFVLHHCDQPGCINPDHLWLGTDADNNADMRSKGRAVYVNGNRVATSRLNREQALEILSSPLRHFELARKFGVTNAAIRQIRMGKNWKYLGAQFLSTHPPPPPSDEGRK